MDFHWEANDVEAMRRQVGQAAEFLHLEIADFAAGAVTLPDQAGVAGGLYFLAGEGEWGVPAPGVGSDHADASFSQPHRGGLAHSAAGIDEIILAVARPGGGVDHDD